MAQAARTIRSGEAEVLVAGGVESMSRAPFVMPKADAAFSRNAEVYDTTIGWRFVNPRIKERYGVDSMPETGENVAAQFNIARADQDRFALRSQQRTAAAYARGFFARELVAGGDRATQGQAAAARDARRAPAAGDHARAARLAADAVSRRAAPSPPATPRASTTAPVRSSSPPPPARAAASLTPRARIVAAATAGVEPRIMGMGPAARDAQGTGAGHLTLGQLDVIELNEAFAAQALAVLRELGLPDDAAHVNPNGGAIALGHPLGMSGARLATTATWQLAAAAARYALCTMCIGVGQGIAVILERV